ncbi:mitochondrial import receptor subunit TOM40 homolog 1-like [Orussus abietinus]|uniref:mitochondrial import receptor subunit TOM40 homolog 1-like n=1 Tax=Orussus abietinus TaxID=222816 RepID=UPI000626C906|nr:mitochondrial import receptor subunit TOM40 homolog 1-like [Orussus abietinus]
MGIALASSNRRVTDDGQPCVVCSEGSQPGNPGSFEDIHKKVKDLYPRNFEGARLTVRKLLSRHFDVSHTVTLSSVTPSGYKFNASYSGTKKVGLHERYPLVSGDLMPNGNLNARLVHTLGCRCRFKFAAQVAEGKYKASSSSLEYRSDDSTVSLTLANPHLMKLQGTVVLHFLQAITSRITLGAEVAYLGEPRVPKGMRTVVSGAFRYSTGPITLSTTIGNAGVHVCYHRKASQQLQLGVELEANFRTHESVGTIVYQLDVPHADLVFRGIVNSETSIGAVFEKKLYPIPESSLVISGLLNHAKQQFRVGIGLNVG